jgi:hypothetical protein
MSRLRWLPFFILVSSCSAAPSRSQLKTSREARYLLQSPANLPPEFWQEMDDPQRGSDFLVQRQLGWNFWSRMLRGLPSQGRSQTFMSWQTWYSREDLQRAFRYLYERLGTKGRRERLSFTTSEIKNALLWNDQLQFQEPDWNTQRFEAWLATFDSEEKQRSIPGMQKILFNQEVMHFLLQNYQSLEICQKQRQRQEDCEALAWPERAVFLKTSWRRSEQGFLVEQFATDATSLNRQWQNAQWLADENVEPAAEESFALRLPTGQKFHLTGMHASLRLQEHWYWTSLWLGAGAGQELAADQPADWKDPWTHYRLCSVDGWQEPLRTQTIPGHWPQPIADVSLAMVDHGLFNWCSNPYLEPGPNNHKTNCTGCHQYAGLNWNQQDFRQRLTDDFWSLFHRSGQPGPADFVWSLFVGPEPLIQPLMDTIEFFDVYDPYQ